MDTVNLTPFDLFVAFALILLLVVLMLPWRAGLARPTLVAALRATAQLLLVGLVLKALFAQTDPGWVAVMATVMLGFAGYEVWARQERRLRGGWGYGAGGLSMFVSAFAVTVLALTVIVEPQPWYTPRYSIPLLGMMLGNAMTGVALTLNTLTQQVLTQRHVIEARLMLGHRVRDAMTDIHRHSLRTGLMPILNAMSAAGVVSLPGMMTGQILAGTPPVEAVKYQILVLFMVTASTGLGSLGALWLGSRRLFDERQRLRLDRLAPHS